MLHWSVRTKGSSRHIKLSSVQVASSKVFRSFICDNNTVNSVIFLHGIKSVEMEAILQFIYLGQTTIFQERVEEFVNTARSLEIKEISNHVDNPSEVTKNEVSAKEIMSFNNETTANLTDNIEQSRQIDVKNVLARVGSRVGCDQCGKDFAFTTNLHRHIKSAHNGVRYPCKKCDYSATNSYNLTRHIKSMHE